MFNSQVLKGKTISLVPLEGKHKPALLAAAEDGKLWELWYTSVPSMDTIDAYIERAITERESGASFAYVVVDNATERIIGTTRYCNADAVNRRVEIGYTWYAQSYQRTSVNTECKFLLLGNAFDHFNCIAVEFRTNWFNERSRNAILRLGAKQDGVLRNHRVDAAGILRDTVVFSIISSEWPVVKKSLKFKLSR